MTKPSKFEANKLLSTGCAALALAAVAFVAAPAAQAQFYFRPFGYRFHRPVEEPAPYASRRGVARILSREGFRLVGPLGSRGDQIVAMGVDARGGRVRFIVDPYEGQVLHSWPIGRPRFDDYAREYDARPQPYGATDDNVAPDEPRVIEGVGGDPPPNARPRAASKRRGAVSPSGKSTPQSQTAARPSAVESASPRATQPDAAPHAPPPDALAPAAPVKSSRPDAGSDRTAARGGGGSKRAITPPSSASQQKAPTHATANPVATPAAPPAQPPKSAAPGDVATPKPAPAAEASPAKSPSQAAAHKEPAKTAAPAAAVGASASEAKPAPAPTPASGNQPKGG